MENKMYPAFQFTFSFPCPCIFPANHKLPSVAYCNGKYIFVSMPTIESLSRTIVIWASLFVYFCLPCLLDFYQRSIMHQRLQMELARAHSTNRRAKNSPWSISKSQESVLGDLNGKDVKTAINLERVRIEWKKLRPSNRLRAPLGE